MNSIPNTAFRRTLCSAFLPAFLFFVASLPVASASLAAPSGDDTLVLTSVGALSTTDMDVNRGSGGTTTTVTVASNQTMDSTSTGNTLNVGGSLTNGPISIGNNFGGSGFGSYVMNTGNNSVINSGVSLSVLMMQ